MARKKSKQLVCPYCGDASFKSISKNRTRCCDGEVVRVNGQIYIDREDSPICQLIDAFVQHKRKTLPMYEIPQGSDTYKEAVACADQLMIKCGNDIGLALTVVDINFEEYQWRGLAGMWALISNTFFPEVLAKANKAMAMKANARAMDMYAHSSSTMQVAGQISPW